jgi:DNA-binding transcriptional MerR regulator
VSSRSYLSIGDVLTLLRQEFPDVTISKIRFLESQGLVNPERTPSGYRKFYEHDVERLRWVLRQQREHFLPLKVIKDRLDDDNGSPVAAPATEAPTAPAEETPAVAEADEEAGVLVAHGTGSVGADPTTASSSGLPGIETATQHRTPARAAVGGTAASGASAAAPNIPVERAHRANLATQSGPSVARSGEAAIANGATNGASTSGPVDQAASPPTPPTPKAPKGSSRRTPTPSATPAEPVAAKSNPGRGSGPTGADAPVSAGSRGNGSLSLEDLCSTSGLSPEGIAELQEYGLINSTVAAGVAFYDEEALSVAKLAGKFAAFGVEARHLRLYKNAADREAGFIEQIVIPMVRQRNPEARARAAQTADELSALGQQMKSSLLRSALHDIL